MQFAFSFSGFLFWAFLFPSFARYFLDIVTVEKEKGKHGFFTELWQKLPPLRRVQAPWQRIPADGGWPPATSHSANSSLPLRPPSWSLPPPRCTGQHPTPTILLPGSRPLLNLHGAAPRSILLLLQVHCLPCSKPPILLTARPCDCGTF